ncbi:Rieske 2Fe-2S domain-containing protein [Mycolicibacter algericus]|nr:Rieske 2Fe-2S domain-containing protein [Mycolicibacter algericus]
MVDRSLTEPAPTFVERGFPHEAFPSRWFQVGWSHEFAPGDVTAARHFGADLALYRAAASGDVPDRIAAFGAYCPHMGALLGSGEVAAAEPDALAKSITAANPAEVCSRTADRRSWENQRCRPDPISVGYEATYTHQFRKRSQQFDPATSPTAGPKTRDVGVLGGQSALRS